MWLQVWTLPDGTFLKFFFFFFTAISAYHLQIFWLTFWTLLTIAHSFNKQNFSETVLVQYTWIWPPPFFFLFFKWLRRTSCSEKYSIVDKFYALVQSFDVDCVSWLEIFKITQIPDLSCWLRSRLCQLSTGVSLTSPNKREPCLFAVPNVYLFILCKLDLSTYILFMKKDRILNWIT